jgi:hypothetical protein
MFFFKMLSEFDNDLKKEVWWSGQSHREADIINNLLRCEEN